MNKARRSAAEDGFALVIVIWAMGVLSLLFVTYIAAARYRSIEAASRVQHMRAEAAAETGVAVATFDLLSGIRNGKPFSPRFRPGGRPTLCTLDSTRIAIAIADEGGKVDLNTAMPELVETALRAFRRDNNDVALAAQSILRFRKSADTPATPGGTSGIPLRSILELDQVAGVSRELLRNLLPWVTVHSRSVGVDPVVAPASLLRALASEGSDPSTLNLRESFPPLFSAESSGKVLAISVTAITALGARSAKDAIVEFTLEPPIGFRIREWRDGSFRIPSTLPAGKGLPACLATGSGS